MSTNTLNVVEGYTETTETKTEQKTESKECICGPEIAYRKALEYVETKTKSSATRNNMLMLLEKIRKGEMITMNYLRYYYPTCYRHFLELRREGIIVLVIYEPNTRPVLRFSDLFNIPQQ